MTKLTRILVMMVLWALVAVAHAGTHHYYYTDPQGTVLAKADANGTIIATYDYAPYGTAVASMSPAPNGPGYTGHVNDPDSGLVYMQARYYDPSVGRFLSADPVAPAAGNAFNFGRYTYASNNPIINMDPDGRATVGENIDENAQTAADAGNKFATFGWAFAGVAWNVFGAESVSQVADKGSGATTGDKVGAGLEVLSALPPIKIVGKAAILVEESAKGIDAVKAGAKFSSEKAALVDMAKSDAKTGVTRADMEAYQDLNSKLPDPFPSEKVRIDEGHPTRSPHSQVPHGHVGPVDHIPIKDTEK